MLLALSIIGGFVGLLVGGELLVRGAAAIAVRLGISPLVVGVVIVGFGTSAPELVTCVRAALGGAPGIAVGNIVGSNIANILLILGAAALMRPFVTSRAAVRAGRVASSSSRRVAFAAVAFTGTIGRVAGSGVRRRADRLPHLRDPLRPALAGRGRRGARVEPRRRSFCRCSFTLLGLVGVIVGAEFLVSGAVELAARYGVSEEVIGLTMVAVGTSLPELATSIIAALQASSRRSRSATCSAPTSTTPSASPGSTALVAPVPVSPGMQTFDIPLMVVDLGAAGGRCGDGPARDRRWEGGAAARPLIGGYVACPGDAQREGRP